MFEGISETMGGLNEGHASPLDDKISMKIKHILVRIHNGY